MAGVDSRAVGVYPGQWGRGVPFGLWFGLILKAGFARILLEGNGL
jgi:hypothetical protein